MKLKLDAEGHAVLLDGKPVYVHDDGKEIAFDAPATVNTISRLNGEAKSHRERAEAAEAKLENFKGIDDPEVARKAMATVKNLDHKKLVDAGEVEKVKAEAIKAVEEKYAPVVTENAKLKSDFAAAQIGGSFSRSKLITDKFAIPADLVQARFGGHFSIEDAKTVAKDQHGNKIYSRTRPGELADFDEALEILVDQYPHKEQILKGTGSSGSGAGPVGGGGGNTPPAGTPKSWAEAKTMEEKAAFIKHQRAQEAAAKPAA